MGRCCSVQHMGEHAIARQVYALPAGGCIGFSRVIHRRNVHPAALTLPPPSPHRRRSTLRDHPPLAGSSPLVRHPFQLYARPNLVPDVALVVFPQIRCSPQCLGGEIREGGSYCGTICGEQRRGGCKRQLPCKTDRPSVEDDRLADTFLINTSSVQHDS